MIKLSVGIFIAFCLILITPSRAIPENVEMDPLLFIANYDFGQLVKMKWDNIPDEMVTYQRTGLWILQKITIEERLKLNLGIGGMFINAYPIQEGFWPTQRKFWLAGPAEISGTYLFGSDVDEPVLSLTFGDFPYKYNPDARNLGEYLFRSWAYPTVLFTGGYDIFNSAWFYTRGFKLHHNMGPLTHDLMFTTETNYFPQHDLALSWVGSYKLGDIVEFGAGVMFNKLIPVKPSIISPEVPANLSEVINFDSTSLYIGDPADPTDDETIFHGGDTIYYSFQSTKLMGRVSFNIQSLLGDMGILKPDDLKLYSEIALLGVKNYAGFYSKRSERMPIMVGFNIPTFGLFDILSVEVEQMKGKYANDIETTMQRSIPIPFINGDLGPYDPKDYEGDDIKWSVYAKRSLVPGFDVYVQVARDHFRTIDIEFKLEEGSVMTEKAHWYWSVRLAYGLF